MKIPDGHASAEDAREFLKRQREEGLKAEIIDLDSKRPVAADALHANPSVSESGERTSVYRTGPTQETATRKPLPEKSTEEKKDAAKEIIQDQPFESISNPRAEMVKKSANDFATDFFGKDNTYLKTILRRWPGGKKLKGEKMEELVKEIETNRDVITQAVSEKVYSNLNNPEIGSKYPEERKGLFLQDIVDDRVFIEMRSAILELAEKYIAEKAKSETKEKPVYTLVSPPKNNEFSEKRNFSDKQLKNLEYLLEVARESSGKFDRSDLEKVVSELILEEFVSRGIFTEDKIPVAVEWVMKRIK